LLDHIVTGAIREQRGHQGTINLEKTDRKRSQVGKRCAASPEIVDGSRDMKALQLGQDIRRMRWIVHRDPIRDFELKCGCFNLLFREGPRESRPANAGWRNAVRKY